MSGEVSAGLGPANEVVAVAKKKAGIGVGAAKVGGRELSTWRLASCHNLFVFGHRIGHPIGDVYLHHQS